VAPRFDRLIAVEVEHPSVVELKAQGYDVRPSLVTVADASVDFLFSVNVLEHIEDDVGALREIRRVLKVDGKVFIYVPAFNQLWTAMDRLVGHRRRYTLDGLQSRLIAAGFEFGRGQYVDSLGAVASFLMRLGRSSGRLSAAAVGSYDRWAFPASRAMDAFLGGTFGKNVAIEATRR